MKSLNAKLAQTARRHREYLSAASRPKEEKPLEERLFLLCRDQLGIVLTTSELPYIHERLHFLRHIMSLTPNELDFVVHRVPQVLSLRLHRQLVPLASYLDKKSISPKELGRIALRCPDLLLVPVHHDLELKVEYLKSVGIAGKTVIRLIRQRTAHFTCHLEFEFRRKADYLLDAGLSVEALLSLMRYSDQLFRLPVEQNIIPKIRFFEERGYSVERTSEMIQRYPFLYFVSLDRVIRPFFEQRYGRTVCDVTAKTGEVLKE